MSNYSIVFKIKCCLSCGYVLSSLPLALCSWSFHMLL